MSGSVLLGLTVAVTVGIGAGCGSSAETAGDSSGDAGSIVQDLKALKPGEHLIKSTRVPRFSGPYTLGTRYVIRWEQESAGPLAVALESRRGSDRPPYQLFEATGRSGTGHVTVSGRLHVHILRASGAYEVRLTPTRKPAG